MHERALVANCSIRTATVVDVTDVIYLTQRGYAEPYRPGTPLTFVDEDEESLVRDMDQGWRLLVAHYGGLAVGAVRWRREMDQLRVAKLVVDPRYRRRGIATALVKTIEAAAGSEGARAITGEVIADKGLVPFFQRIGYAPRAERTAGPLRFVELAKQFGALS